MLPDLQQPKNNTLQEDDDCISNVTSSHNEYVISTNVHTKLCVGIGVILVTTAKILGHSQDGLGREWSKVEDCVTFGPL